MSKETIARRLILISGSLFFIILLVGTMSYMNQNRVEKKYSSIVKQNMPRQKMVLEMFLHFNATRIYVRTLGLQGLSIDQRTESVRKVEEEIALYEKINQEFTSVAFLPNEERYYQALAQAWVDFKHVGQSILHLNQSGLDADRKAMISILLGDCPKAAARFKEAAEALVRFHNEMADTRSLEAEATAQEANRETAGVILLGLTLGVFLSVYFSRSLTRSLKRVTNEMRDARQSVGQTSERLASTSKQLEVSAQRQASSVEEVSASLEEIAGMVGSTVQVSKHVSELLNSGGKSMSELQRAVQEISQSNAAVEQLAKLIEEIGEKTELIDEIVFQTRLLSFNASVEAERAGEHGRGFAVVAQEVGTLAQMSGKSATEITQIVKKSIKTAQEVAQMNRTRVEQGALACQQTASKLEEIQRATQEILKASQEQNSGVQQINQSIHLISRSTQENAASAEDCSKESHALMNQVGSLSGLLNRLDALVSGEPGSDEGVSVASAHPRFPSGSASEPTQRAAVVREPARRVESRKLPTRVPGVSGNLALSEEEDAWEKL
ncbi:MAG: HAMP domain-containing methyl-accepting chemotaxis protein [Bdellovibrionia bacterium]